MNKSNNSTKKSFSSFGELSKSISNTDNKKSNIPKNTRNKKKKETVNKQPNHDLTSNKNNKHFSVNLSRQIEVKRHPVIATICLLQKRDDIVTLLNQAQENPRNLPIRLTAYLKKEGLLNNDDTLTEKAKQVRSTGKMPISERGLYHIWYSNDDPLLGTRVLLIQRDNAFKEPKYKVRFKGQDAERSDFAIKKSENDDKTLTVRFSSSEKTDRNNLKSENIISLLPEVICDATDNKPLNLTWDLAFDSSNITIEGPLNILSGRDLKQTSPVKFEYQQSEHLSKAHDIFASLATLLGGQWLKQVKRASIPFSLTKRHPGMLSSFSLTDYPEFKMATTLGHFEHINLDNFPVEPVKEEAKKWQLAWLEHYHASGFKETEVGQTEQLSWLSQPALKQCKLQLLSGNELIEALSKEKHPHAYWQYSAVHDLTPSLLTMTALPLTLINKELVDINQLMTKLSLNKQCTRFIYSDRYIINQRQQSLLNAITKPLNRAKTTIFTDSDQAEELASKLPEQWNIEPFSKGVDNHDRYWIFQSDDHITAWKCSVSLDFLTFKSSNYYAHGYPTFTPIELKQLPEYLQRNLEQKTHEVMA